MPRLRACDSEERHRLSEAVDRRPPLLPEEQQDGRDEGAGVTDTDPPDEVDDVERPPHRHVVAPDADAGHHEFANRDVQDHQEQETDAEPEEPADRRPLGQDDVADGVGDRLERVARRDDRRRSAIDDGNIARAPLSLRFVRMRALVMQPTISAEDAAEMLPCLSLSRDPEDKKAFEAARKRLISTN